MEIILITLIAILQFVNLGLLLVCKEEIKIVKSRVLHEIQETMFLYDKITECSRKLSNIENKASEPTRTKKFTLED